MTRVALWLLAVIGLALAATHAHRQAQQPRQYPCPPECADCGHSWASSTPVCTPKNMKGVEMPKALDWQAGEERPTEAGVFRRRDSAGKGAERAYWDGEFWHAMGANGRIFEAPHRDQARSWASASVPVAEEVQVGDRFGRLVFVKSIGPDEKSHRWLALFRCDCGNEKAMNLYEVRTGRIEACGCQRHSEESKAIHRTKMREWHQQNAEQVLQTNRRISAAQAGTERALGPTAKWSMNVRAKHWVLIAPNGDQIEGWNLYDLVRIHADRFEAADLIWKDGMCNATKRLTQLFQRRSGRKLVQSWKGWKAGKVNNGGNNVG